MLQRIRKPMTNSRVALLLLCGGLLCSSPGFAGNPERLSTTLTLVDMDGTTTVFKYEDLRQLPQMSVEDCICVGESSGFIGIFDYQGVPLRDVLEKAKAAHAGSDLMQENQYVVFIGTDGYQVIASWTELQQPPNGLTAMLVLEKDGEVLPDTEGFVRLALLGDKYVGRSVKCLERIEIRCAEGVKPKIPKKAEEGPEALPGMDGKE